MSEGRNWRLVILVAAVAVVVVVAIAAAWSPGRNGDMGASAPAPERAEPPAAAPAGTEGGPSVQAGVSLLEVGSGDVTSLLDGLREADASGFQGLQISPDGTRFAFVADWQVHVVDVDGTGVRRLTHGAGLKMAPAWSPDGERIVYVERDFIDGDPDDDISSVDVATSRSTRLTRLPGEMWLPSFHPDGSTIVFTRSSGSGGSLDLWTVAATGGSAHVLVRHGAYGAFSPDGSNIAYHWVGNAVVPGQVWLFGQGISLASADGSRPRSLVAGDPSEYMTVEDLEGTRPQWSPDGTRIAYQACCNESDSIMVAPTEGRPRNRDLGRGSWPSWLDDDTLIVLDYEPTGAGR